MLKTLSVREYGEYTSLKTASEELDITKTELWMLIMDGMRKLFHAYPGQGFIQTKGLDQFRFAGIAGILALNSRIHIEIIPKFLKGNDSNWKDDFLYLSAITNRGHLFNKRLHKAAGGSSDLYEIIASIWVRKFEQSQRKLIKTYVNTTWNDFLLDGDTDEEDIMLPNSDGYKQSGLKLSRANKHNDTLLRSCVVLLDKVRNPQISERLLKVKHTLEKVFREHQSSTSKRMNLSRNNAWLEILELSELLIKNKSLSYSNSGHALMPGFIVRTDEIWERLLLKAAKAAFPEFVVSKNGYAIGQRTYRNNTLANIMATPDLTIQFPDRLFVADAKYKTVFDGEKMSRNAVVSSSDFYESLAFMEATATNLLLLIYPHARSVDDPATADHPVEIINAGNKRIMAFTLGVIGIANKNGYKIFVDTFRTLIDDLKI
ncbi:MAG: hypothetical protein JWP78_1965 [Mucilaginibacter sp.]|nr:hypothetical protein [Mucilaginibacter sp.]